MLLQQQGNRVEVARPPIFHGKIEEISTFFFFFQKFITRCSIAVHSRLSITSSLHGPQGPDCPITDKRYYQYQRRNLT